MNKVVIVTGASRGIGAATAKLLGKNGYAVCINCYKNVKKAELIAEEILANGGKAIVVPADVSKEQEVLSLFKTVDKKLGPVTALVNNAGDNGGYGSVEEISAEKLQSVFAVNVFSTFLCSREAVKRMKQGVGGSIVNLSSEAAKFGGNKLTHYAAAKAAINTFTIGFAREVAPYNIRVNTVSPGIIDTDANRSIVPLQLESLQKTIPMGRMGTVEEVVETIFWLVSEQASYVSGAVISVAGAR